jgi:uncharacterized protein (TIGR03067 family)
MLFLLGNLAAATAADPPAKDSTALTPEKLGEMLTDMALEPRDISVKGAKNCYSITSERDGRKLYINVLLSTDHKVIWFELKTVPVADPNSDVGDAWFRLLARNGEITPAYFTFNEKDRRIYLSMTVENTGLTPKEMRKHYDLFDGFAHSTATEWDPKKFRPVPVAPALSAEARSFLASLDGTWEQVGEEIKGKKASSEDLERAAITYTFAAGKVTIKSAHMAAPIDATAWAAPGMGNFDWDFYFMGSRSVEKGIAKLEGDTLTICTAYHGVERPKDFTTTPEFRGAVRVFKRKP